MASHRIRLGSARGALALAIAIAGVLALVPSEAHPGCPEGGGSRASATLLSLPSYCRASLQPVGEEWYAFDIGLETGADPVAQVCRTVHDQFFELELYHQPLGTLAPNSLPVYLVDWATTSGGRDCASVVYPYMAYNYPGLISPRSRYYVRVISKQVGGGYDLYVNA